MALLVACAPAPPAAAPPQTAAGPDIAHGRRPAPPAPVAKPPPADAAPDAGAQPRANPEPALLVQDQYVAVPGTATQVMLVEHWYGRGSDEAGRGDDHLFAMAVVRLRAADGRVEQREWFSGKYYTAFGERFRPVVQRFAVFLYRLPPLP